MAAGSGPPELSARANRPARACPFFPRHARMATALALFVAGPRPADTRETRRRDLETLVRTYGAALGADAAERKFLTPPKTRKRKRTTPAVVFQKRELDAMRAVELAVAPSPAPVLTLEARPGAALVFLFGVPRPTTPTMPVVDLACYSQRLRAPHMLLASVTACGSRGDWMFQIHPQTSPEVRVALCLDGEEDPLRLQPRQLVPLPANNRHRLVIEDVFICVHLYE